MTPNAAYGCRRVAILSEPGGLLDLTQKIVRDVGWKPELIDEHLLDRSEAPGWSLIIIADGEGSSELARRGAMAARFPGTRVLALSSERNPQHVADVLRAGVDDYLTIPFDPKEYRARILSLVNRSQHLEDQRRFELVIDFDKRTIMSGPMFVALPPREWDVLIELLEAEGRPVSDIDLARRVWNEPVPPATVISTVARIRRRFDQRGFRVIQISTVRREGYTATFRRASDALALIRNDETRHQQIRTT